jgi:hypothetical protein
MTDNTILFLDFDGVLHHIDEAAIDEDFNFTGNPNLFKWVPLLAELLAPYPELRIIVSSDWRRLFDDDALKTFLGPLAARFIGVVETYGPTRAAEIVIEAERRGILRWLALDDHPSVVKAAPKDARFVVCDSSTGIAGAEAQASLRAKLAIL